MKIAEDIFAYLPHCYLAKWIGLCCKTGLFGSFLKCELFGRGNGGDHWLVHSFVRSFIDPFNKDVKNESHQSTVCNPKEAWDPWIHTKG